MPQRESRGHSLVAIVAGIAGIAVGCAGTIDQWMNGGVVRELREEPQGERARKVMLLTLPSGRALPVNYLEEDDTVYAGADGRWWRELEDGGGRCTVLIRGETRHGNIRAERDDPELRDSVFERLRPSAPRFLGTLIVIELDPADAVEQPDRPAADRRDPASVSSAGPP